jgi:hypothetical protein
MTMVLSRREAVIGAAALMLAGTAPAFASTGTRRLDLFRDGNRIGDKAVTVARDGNRVEVQTRITIEVKILGITAYRYGLSARESWVGGQLQTLRAETNDNGTAHFARAERRGGVLRVEGSEFTGEVGGLPATTSYWSPAFLERPVWISTQDGRLLNVRATNRGPMDFPTESGTVPATRWEISGDLTGLMLYFDASGEWLGTEFPARGATARFITTARGPDLTPLWVNA